MDADGAGRDTGHDRLEPCPTLHRPRLFARDLLPPEQRIDLTPSASPAVPPVVGFQSIHQGRTRGALQTWIQSGPNVVTASVQALVAEFGHVERDPADLLDEIVRIAILRARRGLLDDQIFLDRRFSLCTADPAKVGHLIQNPVPSDDRLGLAAEGMVVVGTLRQRGQIGVLGERQVTDGFAEVVIGGCAHPVRAISQPDFVEVELQDALLGQGPLKLRRQDRLFELPPNGWVGRQQDILRDLLGDRRAALQPPALGQIDHILEQRAAKPAQVQSTMLEEAAILRSEEGLGRLGRNGVIGNEDPPLTGEFADQGAIPGVGSGGGGRVVVHQIPRIGHVVEQPGRVDCCGEGCRSDQAEHAHADDGEPSLGIGRPLRGGWGVQTGQPPRPQPSDAVV